MGYDGTALLGCPVDASLRTNDSTVHLIPETDAVERLVTSDLVCRT